MSNQELAYVLAKKLIGRLGAFYGRGGVTIALAESCTGGLLSAAITSVPGSSNFYTGGVSAYSNSIKEKILKVKKETLSKFGAVSVETASEMARNVAKAFGADFGASVTGIAGPGGGSDEKPVGTVCFGFYDKRGECSTFRKVFTGGREDIRSKSVVFALKQMMRSF